jgi:hypothetical protein
MLLKENNLFAGSFLRPLRLLILNRQKKRWNGILQEGELKYITALSKAVAKWKTVNPEMWKKLRGV